MIILTIFYFPIEHKKPSLNTKKHKKKSPYKRTLFCLTSNALSSQPVSRQVLSAYECLTTVFGMGTGGTTQLSSLDIIE